MALEFRNISKNFYSTENFTNVYYFITCIIAVFHVFILDIKLYYLLIEHHIPATMIFFLQIL